MMMASPLPAPLVSFETENQLDLVDRNAMNIDMLELSEGESDTDSDTDDDDDDFECAAEEDVVSVVKTVCTVSTSDSSEDSVTSVEDEGEINADVLISTTGVAAAPSEVDADEIDVDEIGADELLTDQVSTKFRYHRSSILLPVAQDDECEEAADSIPPPAIPAPVPLQQRRNTAPAATRRRRSSIKLSSLSEPIPVKQSAASWKQLPKPDLAKIHRAVSLPLDLVDNTAQASRNLGSVAFTTIEIRNYGQTIGDNPSVSYGPPIQLDWDYESVPLIPIDDYEGRRGPRRQLKHMSLSYYQRMHLLQNAFGHTEEDLKQAKKQANKDKFKRAVTKYFLPVQVLEDVAESSVRKTKRFMMKNRRQSTV